MARVSGAGDIKNCNYKKMDVFLRKWGVEFPGWDDGGGSEGQNTGLNQPRSARELPSFLLRYLR